MKKLFIIAAMAIVLSACSNNSKNESETSTQQETMSLDSNSMSSTDSTKAVADKMTQDSVDAAHGHSH